MSAAERDTSFTAWVVAVLTETYQRSKDTETKVAWISRLVIAVGLFVVPNVAAMLGDGKFPRSLRVLPALAYLMLYAPYAVWRKERLKVSQLQERAEPSLTVTTDVRGYGKSRKLVASLKVSNNGTGQIRNCTGRLMSLIGVKGDDRKSDTSAAMYLNWSTGDGGGKYLTFQSEAHLDVVVMEKPYQGKMFIHGVDDGKSPNLNVTLKEPRSYILRIEVAAENSAPVVADYLCSVEPLGQFAHRDGDGGFDDTIALPALNFRRL
jgi:hypothetical protein